MLKETGGILCQGAHLQIHVMKLERMPHAA
jgi:hypothetical protein